MPSASLIISFYNKIEWLKFIITALERQTYKEFEIIIADDGSNENVVNELKNIISESNLNIKHIWHEDLGFRKNKILNKAVVLSESDFLIFIDGDCIPHKEFIKEHVDSKSKGICFTGRRVNLSEKITSNLTNEKIKNGWFENNFYKLVLDGIFGNSIDVEKGFYFRNKLLRKFFNKKKRGIVGCNFSLCKEDLLNINGFDERYEAPSIGEDSDVQFRLELNGVKIKSLNNIAVQYHLYHKLQPRLQINLDLFEKIKSEKIAYTKYGIINN